MPRNLVPIKVTIGLKDDGSAKYPDFNSMAVVQATGMDWSKYIDVHGTGWHYDKVSGHKDEDVDSPYGQQYGVLLVPKAFADEAVSTFPECVKLNEPQCEDFIDNRAHAHLPDEEVNTKILDTIKVKQDNSIPLTQSDQDALDPNNRAQGIRKNLNKKFKDFKALKGINIVQ